MEAPAYVKWKEAFVLSEKGTKEVRYYLKREDGSLDLAVVGTMKHSLVPLPYCYNVCNKALLNKGSFVLNLKSRTQVVHWLDSFVSGASSHHLQPSQSVCGLMEVRNDFRLSSETIKDGRLWKLGKHTAVSFWLGSSSTCKEKRKHYQSFQHGSVRFSIHDFVYVLAEEDKPRVAYLDDMYEDSGGKKMVVVRWFHRIDEVCIALPETYNDREIFFSLRSQDLNIEYIDGLASVLSPQHYKIFLREARHTQFKPFVCHKQIDDDDVKPFDITRVKGYSEQKIFDYMLNSPASKNFKNQFPAKDGLKVDVEGGNSLNVKPKKRLRISYNSAKFLQPSNDSQVPHTTLTVPKLTDGSVNYKGGCQMYPLNDSISAVPLATKDVALTAGAEVEVLCQDSGVRGCWFRASIIKKNKDKVKVRYLDIKDAADEVHNLEEWIFSSRVALPDEWCLRINGRATVRPAPVYQKARGSLVVKDGSVVDVWWHDGWWEGIIIRKESEDNFLVYFPAEKCDSVFSQNDLRPSQEWLGIGWKQMNDRPDLVSSVFSDLCRKLDTAKFCDGGCPPCKSVACDDKVQFRYLQEDTLLKSYEVNDKSAVLDIVKDDLLANLKWKSSRKRKHSRISSEKLCQNGTKNISSIRAFGTRTWEKFFVSSSIKVDQENRKFTRESAFSYSTVSPLSNMVLSQ